MRASVELGRHEASERPGALAVDDENGVLAESDGLLEEVAQLLSRLGPRRAVKIDAPTEVVVLDAARASSSSGRWQLGTRAEDGRVSREGSARG